MHADDPLPGEHLTVRPALAWLLAVVLLAGLPAAAQSAPAAAALPPGGTFLDDDQAEGEAAIEALYAAGITAGCGPAVFCPNRPVTRAETAVFLTRALRLAPGDQRAPFGDLDPEAWYALAVDRLYQTGVFTGYPDLTFRAEATITRAEMAAVLVRALGLTPATNGGSFQDVPAGVWFSPLVEALRLEGVTAGCGDGRFCPGDPVSRQQLALFLMRGLKLTPLPPPARYGPLNGLAVPDGFAVHRRVIAVKIDNAAGARPQSGIERADAMIELPVEGDLTRLIALFHQSAPDYAGPVRSARPTDELLVSLGATAAISGAQPWIADLVAGHGLPLIREGQVGAPALFRISARTAPHNLYASVPDLRAEADRRGYPDAPPPDLARFGDPPYDGHPAATTVVMSWSNPIQVTWRWDGARYLRWMPSGAHMWTDRAGGTGQVAAESLIVIFGTRYEVAPPPGTIGSAVPAVVTIGSGRMLAFVEGRVVEGTWSRPDNGSWFRFEAGGAELIIPPGVAWISVFPDDRPVVWS